MTWFDIQYGGQTYVENLTGGDEKTLVGLGFHGYASEAQARAHPDHANYPQMLVAANILAGHPAGGVNTPNPPGSTTIAGAGAAAAAAGSAWNAATAVPRFLSMLTSGALWIRVAEVVAGLILLGIGLNAMLKGKPMAMVTGTAGKLGTAAML